MKKIISILLTMIMVLSITTSVPLSVSAETEEIFTYTDEYGTWTYELTDSGDSYKITDYDESETYIKIPSEIDGIPVVEIGYGAFKFYRNLTSVIIPDSVTTIDDNAFYACESLTSVTIPDSVTTINYYAFGYCTKLTSITIPSSVTYIDDLVFKDCTSLTDINVSSNNNNYSSVDGVLFNKTQSELILYPAGKTSDRYIIPDSVTTVWRYAFRECSALTSITINDNVNCIEDLAIQICNVLTNINVSSNNNNYSSVDGVLFNKTQSELILYPAGKIADNYIIPNNITTIATNAFESCENLTGITIPDSVTTINDFAFYNCSSLTSITIPDSVTFMGRGVFEYCYNLTNVVLPNSITSFNGHMFARCISLTSITIPDSVTTIEYAAFYDCEALTSITIPDSVTFIDESVFAYCANLTDVYYTGSESEWNSMSINADNDALLDATIHFNYEPPKAGDVNLDGEVSVTDVISVLKYIIGSIDLTDEQIVLADINKDNEVTVVDAILIQKIILEML